MSFGLTDKDLNFVSKNISNEDLDLFFGPLENEKFIVIEEHWSMANILHVAGIFPSISQARKNGADKPIPNGFTHLVRGKKANRKNIFILK